MNNQDADTVIMLSSELIAEVMESYFNKVMFKQKVKIVDLKPTETGYAFSLAFVQQKLTVEPASVQKNGHAVSTRDGKGKFVRSDVKQSVKLEG